MHQENNNPYLTMVTCTRNDEYGGGIIERLQFTMNIIFKQIEHYKIKSELIIVEWNPQKDKPKLASALSFPEVSNYLSIKILEVPEDIHQRYIFSERHPMHAAVAFNAALVRARGEFTVYRVSDAIWSKELIENIAKQNLRHDTKYRCTRADVNPDVLKKNELGLFDLLNYCYNNITTVMKKMPYYISGLPPLRLNSDGDFQLLATEQFKALRGYYETRDVNSANVDGLLEFCAYAAGIKDELWEDIYIYKIDNDSSYKRRMTRSLSPIIDSILKSSCIMRITPLLIKIARITGLTRLFYDNRIVTVRSIKMPTRNEYYEQCKRIIKGEESYVLNGEDWGLRNENLKESLVIKAAWEDK